MTVPSAAVLSEFETLVETHSREIFAYLWRLVQDNADAEDCLQDTFLRAYQAFPKLENHDNLRAWLYKIASNVAMTHLKKRKRQQARTTELSRQIPLNGSPVQAQAEAKISLEQVRCAIEELPEKQQAALMMHKFQGLNYSEIAAALDIKEDAARANVYQAMKKLRAQFSEQEEEL